MELYAGLMSGTSLDGVDVAVAGFAGRDERPAAARLVAFRSVPYEEGFRERLGSACVAGSGAELCALSFDLGRRFAAALVEALEEGGIRPGDLVAIGSHGQTVWHAPPSASGTASQVAAPPPAGARAESARAPAASPPGTVGRGPGDGSGSTLQIGEGAVIAELVGRPVVEDFRVRDVAAGGQGAPLTAYFDRLLLGSPAAARAIQNLGGMGNVTALPREGGGASPLAFDTGPGVALLDGAAARLSGGRLRHDEDGRLAARGRVDEAALAEWLEDEFFRRPPPRSTGRERFGEPALERWLGRHADLTAEDALATLTELTARSVAEAHGLFGFAVEEAYLCGGGARNPELRRRIEARLAPVPVRPLEALDWDGDAREAAAFALLARQHLLGIPVAVDWATGARGPRLLGKRVPA